MSFIQSCQVHSGSGYQGGQFGDKVHWLEDDVSRAISIRGFQLIANPALFRQRQTLFSDGRSGDVAAQTLQLVTLPGFGRHSGVQGDKIAGSDFEQLRAGPKGGGQDARSNPATFPTAGVSSAPRSSGSVARPSRCSGS